MGPPGAPGSASGPQLTLQPPKAWAQCSSQRPTILQGLLAITKPGTEPRGQVPGLPRPSWDRAGPRHGRALGRKPVYHIQQHEKQNYGDGPG